MSNKTGWVVGGTIFVLGVIGLLGGEWLAGLAWITVSMLFLPPVESWFHAKTGHAISSGGRVISIFSILLALFVIHYQELAIAKARTDADNLAYFVENKAGILESTNKLMDAENFGVVIAKTDKYLGTDDADIKTLNDLAKTRRAAKQVQADTIRLTDELKTIPVFQYDNNLTRYKQLLVMHPGSKEYSNKVAFYTKKMDEAEQERLISEVRRNAIEKQFSPWDGSHIKIERLIKQSMGDPDSYEHVKTSYFDQKDHLIVNLVYRGRNAYGGTVQEQIKARVSLTGDILAIIEQI